PCSFSHPLRSRFLLPCPFVCRRVPRSTLFPYTTLFRSVEREDRSRADRVAERGQIGGGCAGDVDIEILLHPGATSANLPTLGHTDRKSTRLNSSHQIISYAVFCLKKKKSTKYNTSIRTL